jgi:hypothetical protein
VSFSVFCVIGRTLNERVGKYGSEEGTLKKLRSKRRMVKKNCITKIPRSLYSSPYITRMRKQRKLTGEGYVAGREKFIIAYNKFVTKI